MEAESTASANGVAVAATNGLVAEATGVDIAEEAAVVGDVIDYLEEGDVAVHTEEEEMGEAEYLESEILEEECEDERELIEEEATDKSNAVEQQPAAENEAMTEAKDAIAAGNEDGNDEGNDKAAEVLPTSGLEDEEGELITGDEPQAESAEQQQKAKDEDANSSRRVAAQKKEEVDENQCRVCTSKEDLVSLFKKVAEATPADMLLVICPSVSIALKDFMPQFICQSCLDSVTIAIQLKNRLETTERELRKHLSRGKNKVRRPRGYVVIDAPVSDSASEEEELIDDVEFKVSDVAGSTSADSDSADSDISEKRLKRATGRGRRPRKKPTKRAAGGSISGSNEDEVNVKKKCLTPPTGQALFECDHCEQSFARKQSYVLHRKTHDTRNDFSCEICNKKFKVQRAYKTHLERHEAERAQFRCELCSQVFKLRSELKRHMAVQHDEYGLIYECKRCQRTFLTQTRLQRHQSTNCPRFPEPKSKRSSSGDNANQGRDLFKSVAPLTTTYWSDSFSD